MKSYAIFSLGDLQGTSSSSSSSLSSPSSCGSVDMFSVELVNISGTGSILGRLLPRRWFNISGLSRLGLSPDRGISKWLPVTEVSNVNEPGELSLRQVLESMTPPEVSGNVAVNKT